MKLHIWIDLDGRNYHAKVHNSGSNIIGAYSPLSLFHVFTSLFCNDSGSTNAIEMKLHIWINYDERKCCAQDQ